MGFKLWTKPQLRHKYFVVLVKGEKWALDYGLEDIKVTNIAIIEFFISSDECLCGYIIYPDIPIGYIYREREGVSI